MMMMKIPSVAKFLGVGGLSLLSLMPVGSVSAQALKQTMPEIAQSTVEKIAYNVGCYAKRGVEGDIYERIAQYSTNKIPYDDAQSVCAEKLAAIGPAGVAGGLTGITTKVLPDTATGVEIGELTGSFTRLPTEKVTEKVTKKSTATNLKGGDTVTLLNLDDNIGPKDFITVMLNGVRVRIPTDPKQAIAFCGGISRFKDGILAVTEVFPLPARLAGASTQEILDPKNGVNGITEFRRGCLAKQTNVFGTTAELVSITLPNGKKIKTFALPREFPRTLVDLKKFETTHPYINFNTFTNEGGKTEL